MELLNDVRPEEATREQVEFAVSEWRKVREERLAQEKIAKKLEESEKEYKQFLISALRCQNYEGVLRDGRVTGVVTKPVPVCEDRAAFEEFVLGSGSLQLLQFRLSTSAIAELQDDGVKIPGIGSLDTFDLFDRKA